MELELVQKAEGLTLAGDGMELRADFCEMLPRIRQGALQRELLVKAAKLKSALAPRALDMTAGLGEDSFLLAAAGFDVTLCEMDETIALLLEDALERAAADEATADIAARMHLVKGDSLEVLASLAGMAEAADAPDVSEPAFNLAGEDAPCSSKAFDVIYLDPMFPERRKSAAVKKKFQLLHGLERPCANEEEMLQAALAAKPRKIVVKRPAKGEYLAGKKPSYSIGGKAVRYDVLVP